jgi:glucose/arabinose dehydrogenase
VLLVALGVQHCRPAGTKMYVTVGSATNATPERDERRAAINEYSPDGRAHRVFASGLRNPVGLAYFPGATTLWTAVNDRDQLGDDLVTSW